MRQGFVILSILLSSCFAIGQQASSQNARQALLEMFFGDAPGHFEKHLPDATRRSLNKLNSPDGQNYLAEFSMLASQMHAGGANFQTFDTGPILLSVEDAHIAVQGPQGGGVDKIELTVERDDLAGDEDQIELGLHMSRNGTEVTSQTLPVIPRFTFSMKQEANIWRLNEIAVTVRLPLADPTFLKAIEDRQRSQNEQATIWSIQQINMAEKSYSAAEGHFACSLSALSVKGQSGGRTYLYDPQLAAGRKNGYVFAISACDATHYKVVAEAAVSGSGQRAFCSDESGAVRASSDGKATTCLASGEVVQQALPDRATAAAAVAVPGGASTTDTNSQIGSGTPAASQRQAVLVAPAVANAPQRVRVSQAVMQGMKLYEVAPVYPADAGAQGSVVLEAIIGKDGTVQNLHVLSTASPLLNQAAIDAVKQWKYRPYLLNGQPVEVDTQITVNFTFAPK